MPGIDHLELRVKDRSGGKYRPCFVYGSRRPLNFKSVEDAAFHVAANPAVFSKYHAIRVVQVTEAGRIEPSDALPTAEGD